MRLDCGNDCWRHLCSTLTSFHEASPCWDTRQEMMTGGLHPTLWSTAGLGSTCPFQASFFPPSWKAPEMPSLLHWRQRASPCTGWGVVHLLSAWNLPTFLRAVGSVFSQNRMVSVQSAWNPLRPSRISPNVSLWLFCKSLESDPPDDVCKHPPEETKHAYSFYSTET